MSWTGTHTHTHARTHTHTRARAHAHAHCIPVCRPWLELQKLRGKMKRKVDIKASKGRKLRCVCVRVGVEWESVLVLMEGTLCYGTHCTLLPAPGTKSTKSWLGSWHPLRLRGQQTLQSECGGEEAKSAECWSRIVCACGPAFSEGVLSSFHPSRDDLFSSLFGQRQDNSH